MAYSGPIFIYWNNELKGLKMPRDTRITMPSGMGGLMRYFDEYKSRIRIKPGHIILMCGIVMAIMIFLYSYGNSLLGI